MERTNDAHCLDTDYRGFRPFNPADLAKVLHGTLDVRDHGLAPTVLRDPWEAARWYRARRLLGVG